MSRVEACRLLLQSTAGSSESNFKWCRQIPAGDTGVRPFSWFQANLHDSVSSMEERRSQDTAGTSTADWEHFCKEHDQVDVQHQDMSYSRSQEAIEYGKTCTCTAAGWLSSTSIESDFLTPGGESAHLREGAESLPTWKMRSGRKLCQVADSLSDGGGRFASKRREENAMHQSQSSVWQVHVSLEENAESLEDGFQSSLNVSSLANQMTDVPSGGQCSPQQQLEINISSGCCEDSKGQEAMDTWATKPGAQQAGTDTTQQLSRMELLLKKALIPKLVRLSTSSRQQDMEDVISPKGDLPVQSVDHAHEQRLPPPSSTEQFAGEVAHSPGSLSSSDSTPAPSTAQSQGRMSAGMQSTSPATVSYTSAFSALRNFRNAASFLRTELQGVNGFGSAKGSKCGTWYDAGGLGPLTVQDLRVCLSNLRKTFVTVKSEKQGILLHPADQSVNGVTPATTAHPADTDLEGPSALDDAPSSAPSKTREEPIVDNARDQLLSTRIKGQTSSPAAIHSDYSMGVYRSTEHGRSKVEDIDQRDGKRDATGTAKDAPEPTPGPLLRAKTEKGIQRKAQEPDVRRTPSVLLSPARGKRKYLSYWGPLITPKYGKISRLGKKAMANAVAEFLIPEQDKVEDARFQAIMTE
eukprot:SM000010S04215  [mRNA]  locus=s10:381309:384389:+ [translate_table: standard]